MYKPGGAEHDGLMDSNTLRAVQAPLKQQYRNDAAAAMVTLCAEGELGMGVSCRPLPHPWGCRRPGQSMLKGIWISGEPLPSIKPYRYQTLARSPALSVTRG